MRPLSLVFAALLSQAAKFTLFPLMVERPRTLAAACGLLVLLTGLPAYAQPCAPPPSGMVAWWRLDETGGTAVADALGQNPGTASGPIGPSRLTDNPQTVKGLVGNALSFFFKSRVTVNHQGRLDFGTDKSFTIDAWFKGSDSPIVGNLSNNFGTFYTLGVANDKLWLQMAPSKAWYGPPITRDAWTFVAVVVDRTNPTKQTVTLYTADTAVPNSKLKTSGHLSNPDPSGANAGVNLPLYIGGCAGNPNGCSSVIDELEIFNRPLEQEELQKIVNAGSAGKCNIQQKKGMTWIHSKSDATTGTITVGCSGCDGYHGDTECTESRPLLCIYKPTPPFQLPKGLDNSDKYNQWSGGVVATTEPVAGNTFAGIAAANSRCEDKFGKGWRVAEFHDGKYWNFQAYGGTVSAPTVPSTRFWVYINDQKDGNCWK
jgi:Concanavalin A-like lectin/glucanases superfamily